MEENKNFDISVWTEEQWEKWIYSFALEIEEGKIKAPFLSRESAAEPFNLSS